MATIVSRETTRTGLARVWCSVDGRALVCVGDDHALSDAEAEARARTHWARVEAMEAAAQSLRARYPRAAVVVEGDDVVAYRGARIIARLAI